MNYRKPIACAIGGALVVGVGICEGRENPHVDQRQHEEMPRVSYEIANSTATASIIYPASDWLVNVPLFKSVTLKR